MPAARVEPLEPRRLLAAHLGYYYAPASIANGTITATVDAGTAPLLTAGTYTIQPNSVPQAIVGATGASSTDTYSYNRTARGTAILRFTDAATGITYADTLTFSNAADTNGTFSVAPAISGQAGATQTGLFIYTAAVSQIGGDPIATILTTADTKPTVNANTAGVAAVKITNAGNVNDLGFVGAAFYLSPDGLLADATPLGTNGRFLFLRKTQSFNTVLHFTYPNLPSGPYYLVASLAPSLQFIDTDRGNDLATSLAPVQVNARSYDLTVPALTAHPVGGNGRQTGTVVIQNNDATTAFGLVRVDVSAVDADGTQTPVSPQGIPVNLDLAGHHRLALPISFTSAGSGFVATINTSGLSTVPQPFVALSTTLLSAAPFFVQPRNAIPGALNGHRLARVVLSVSDTGNVPLLGRVAVNIEASADAQGDSPTILTSVEKNLSQAVGGRSQFAVDFLVPATIASGNYFILAQVGPSLTTLTEPAYTARIAVPVSNLAPTAAPVLIVQPPTPLLAAALVPLPSSVVTTTQTQDVSVVLTNTGTGPAKGQYLLQIVASAIGNPNAVGRLPLIVAQTRTLNLAAGASQTITVPVRLTPHLLRYAAQFVLVANIDAAGIDHITNVRLQAISTQLLTLTIG